MASSTEQKTAYDRDGFIVVREFLKGKEFHELRDNLDRFIREIVPTLAPNQAFYDDRNRPETLKQLNALHVDPYFQQNSSHPRWSGLAEMLIGESAKGDQPQWFNKPPNTNHPTPPHQDNYYFCLAPPNVLTMWLALDVVDEENGCLRYVPGSHKHGFRPHQASAVLGFSQGISDYGPADESQEVKVLLQPGDAVIHHGMMIHRADPNRSKVRHRPAFAMVMRGASCRRDEAAYARYLEALKNQHQKIGLTQ